MCILDYLWHSRGANESIYFKIQKRNRQPKESLDARIIYQYKQTSVNLRRTPFLRMTEERVEHSIISHNNIFEMFNITQVY